VSAFEEAFKLEYNNEDENKKRQRVYWRDIIQREEVKTREEAKQIEEEERIARLKVEQKGDGFEFKDDEVKEITSVNPIADFKKMVSDRKVDRVSTAIQQLQALIEKFIKNSLKGDLYQKAIECIAQMRDTCIHEDEAQTYNEFMKRVKRVFSKGSYKDFFIMLVQAEKEQGMKVSLITQKESTISSNITEAEAKKVRLHGHA
jgi:ATP-dependent DNA helicase 2 subunit 2